MSKSKTRKLRLLSPLFILSMVFLIVLGGCGTGPDSGTGGITPPPTPTPGGGTLTLALTKDGPPIVTTSSVSTDSPTRLTATARDANGQPIAGQVITFTQTPTNMITFNPASAALTDSSGVATVLLYAGTNPGATSIGASITHAGGTINSSIGIAIATSNLSLSALTIAPSTISAGGSASVSVTVRDGSGNPYLPSVPVTFTSSGVQAGKATITATVATVNGIASATYRDINYGTIDTIRATLAGTTITQSGTITVNPAAAGSIIFVSATPIDISLPGTGRTEQSVVLFRVLDTNGNPKQEIVDFTLDTSVGGITLTAASAQSDPTTGNVQTIVQAGSVPTPVRVQAVIRGTTLTSTSDRLSISTGIPAQNALSLSATTLNIEGWNYDGTTTQIYARMADRFLNPVPNGTVVNFRTSGSQVNATCRTGEVSPCQPSTPHVQGECCVLLTSAAPRPYVGQPGAQPAGDGRVVVLAYALGEESFVDANSNGRFDIGETWTDMPEPYLDVNESGAKDPLEPYIDTNLNGSYSIADGIFNGILRDPSISGPTQIHVRQSIRVILSGSDAVISVAPNPIELTKCVTGEEFVNTPVTAFISVTDVNNNIMPAGTQITIATSNGTINSPSALVVSNAAPNFGASILYPVTIRSDASQSAGPAFTCTNPISRGYLSISVRTPRGLITYDGSTEVND